MPSGKEKEITLISVFRQGEEKTSVKIKGGFRGHLSYFYYSVTEYLSNQEVFRKLYCYISIG